MNGPEKSLIRERSKYTPPNISRKVYDPFHPIGISDLKPVARQRLNFNRP
jgi:hypothetical protein